MWLPPKTNFPITWNTSLRNCSSVVKIYFGSPHNKYRFFLTIINPGIHQDPHGLRLLSVGNVTKKVPRAFVSPRERSRVLQADSSSCLRTRGDMWFKAISHLDIKYSTDGDKRRRWVRHVCGGAVWRKQIVSIAPRAALLSLCVHVKTFLKTAAE